MSETIYRLMSGKIARPDKDGVNQVYKAPYDFVPTPSEYAANKFRLKPIGKASGEPDVLIPATKAVSPDTPLVEDIHKMDVKTAVIYAANAANENELDLLLEQESTRPVSRRKVIEAIEARRSVLRSRAGATAQ